MTQVTILAGYGETYGQARVLETLQTFLAAIDQNASQLKLTDANIGQFLNFFLEQHEGGMPSEMDMDEPSEPDGTSLSLLNLLKFFMKGHGLSVLTLHVSVPCCTPHGAAFCSSPFPGHRHISLTMNNHPEDDLLAP